MNMKKKKKTIQTSTHNSSRTNQSKRTRIMNRIEWNKNWVQLFTLYIINEYGKEQRVMLHLKIGHRNEKNLGMNYSPSMWLVFFDNHIFFQNETFRSAILNSKAKNAHEFDWFSPTSNAFSSLSSSENISKKKQSI